MLVLAYVSCAYVQPAPDDGLDRHGADGGPLARISAGQQDVLHYIICGQHLHLLKGLHCRSALTQHELQIQNRMSEKCF